MTTESDAYVMTIHDNIVAALKAGPMDLHTLGRAVGVAPGGYDTSSGTSWARCSTTMGRSQTSSSQSSADSPASVPLTQGGTLAVLSVPSMETPMPDPIPDPHVGVDRCDDAYWLSNIPEPVWKRVQFGQEREPTKQRALFIGADDLPGQQYLIDPFAETTP